jgi:HEAT repeat protein
MAKARSIDAKLNRLRTLRTEPASPAQATELRELLGDKSNFVVAGAAEIVGECGLVELGPTLVDAFQRFVNDPVENDKLCRAKIAIAEALHKIEFDAEETLRIAIRFVQAEPAWGGSEDTAAPLRATAAFALLRIGPRDLLILLAELLTDTEKVARAAAAKALGASGQSAAIPLLRFKARTGDEEPEVVGECLNALIAAEPKESIPFVAEFLGSSDDAVAEGAVLALAESRRPEALEILKKHWPRARGQSLESVLLLAIAITRLPAGIDFLLDVLEKEGGETAASALSALAIHRHNPSVKERVAAVMSTKKAPDLKQRFEKEFGKA